MFLFYRQREKAGVGILEDILQVKDGKATLRANCVPGSACQLRDQQSFFGSNTSAEKLSSDAFEIVLKRFNTNGVPSIH